MEALFVLVRDSCGDCEYSELVLVMLLRLSRLESERPWFTSEMVAHWRDTEDLQRMIRRSDKKKPYRIKTISLLVDSGQLKKVIDLIDQWFMFDARIIKKIHSLNVYAARLCLSIGCPQFDPDSSGEFADWLIENFDHQDPQIFVGFVTNHKMDGQDIAKIINHVPETLRYLYDYELNTNSKTIVEMAILHGMAQKLHPNCFSIPELSDSAIKAQVKYPPDDFPMDPAWLADDNSGPKSDAELKDYGPIFHADYLFYYSKRWDADPPVDPNNIEELQEIYDDDPRRLVAAALCDTYRPQTIPLKTVEWFIAHFGANNLYLFAHAFINCDSLEGGRLLLEYAPSLLLYVKDWSLTDAAFTDLVIEYGAGHKMLPQPGKGDAYNQAVKTNEYLLTEGSVQLYESDLILILDSNFPMTPHKLALAFRDDRGWPQLAKYLESKTNEYRQEYEACCELLYPSTP
jgi:hypothetical protein